MTQTLSGASAAQLTRQAAADPEVLALDVDTRSSALATDPYRSTQWALDALAADTVNARHDASDVTVAVVDSGVQADHPDLTGVVLAGTDYVAPGGDGSSDGAGHGTHVAGIIAAVAGNGIGVAGFAHGAKILPVRVLDNSGSGWNSDIAAGIIWAANHAAKVVNLSLGGTTRDTVMESAVNYAVSRGVLVVAAAGNSRQNGNAVSYPAAFANTLAVAATDVTGATASFSNTGSYVRIAAPGVNISSTWKNDGYVYASGTSMATPYVAAAAAVLASASPTSTPAELTAALTSTAVDKGAAGRDAEYGSGIVNPAAALCSLACEASPDPTPEPTSSPTTVPTTTSAPTTNPTTTTNPATSTTAKTKTTLALGALPTRVRYGTSFAVTAKITAAGRPLAGAPVRACLRKANGQTSCLATRSVSTGALSWRFIAYGSGTVTAIYGGSATTTAATSAVSTLRVQSMLTISVPGRGRLNLTVQPLLGQTVALQRLRGSRWTTVARRNLPNTGTNMRAEVTTTGLTAGVYRFHVTAGSGLLAETLTGRVNVASAITRR
jgi:hypothetical protein